MSGFLTDTLVWTGALLVLVLLIRRPVAAVFGPKAAYALWALPMARLLLPPLVLPAWMAPAPEPVAAVDAALLVPAAAEPLDIPVMATAEAGPLIDWAALLFAVWLAGAAVFLVRRYALYFKMRRELLAHARPVGEAGRVRLVETPAADGPVAFGVLDKVVALPPGFMAGRDRAARDLALAHELAHHRGHDLVCNMLVQPLFALHWFTPLATLGWRALRRDQEAACDARVIACQPRENRAAYAAVIARFATQPRHAGRLALALAAPMACPVLGDRSIVQRLKSLTMTDISARRRWAGRAMIAAAALALPLTGSISYAQSEPVSPPAPPAPVTPPAALAAPTPPAAPTAPEAPSVVVSKDGKRIVRVERIVRDGDGDDKTRRVERRIVLRDGKEMTAEERADFEQDMKDYEEDMAEYRRDMAEHAREMAEMQRELAAERAEIDREVRMAVAEAHAEARAAIRAAPKVTVRCREGQREVTETVVSSDGQQRIYVCKQIAMADARKAIAAARVDIARAREMSEASRAEALRGLDEAERSLRAN